MPASATEIAITFLPNPTMTNLIPTLLKRVCGLSTTRRVDGKPLPKSLQYGKPIVVMHNHRLSAGVFELRARSRGAKPRYRIAVWKTFTLRSGTEIATTSLYRDEIESAVGLLSKCSERLSLH